MPPTLAPGLRELDAHLVAVSLQAPDHLEAVKRRHDLDFFVASDAFNIGFSTPDVKKMLGTGRSTLPFAAVVVTGRSGLIRLADVHADWSTVTALAWVLDAVRGA